jgi:alkylation response protein AidB-like acyl-CoA dehydrogenase
VYPAIELTDKQEAFRQEVIAFAVEHISPELVEECDEEGRPPLELLPKLAERGWLRIGLPEEHGGWGGATELVIMLEHLEYAFIQLGSLMSRGAMYPANVLSHFGTPEQQARFLPQVLRGEGRTVIAISEPSTGSDMSSLSTRATADADGGWRLNGEKMYASGLDYSNFILVAAITDPDAPSRKGVSVFLIDVDSPGISATRLKTMGAWQNRTYHCTFTDVYVPADRLLGKLNNGWRVLGGHLGIERAGIAARAVGAAQSVLDEAVRYSKERHQFGQPISSFQAISHKIAEMATGIHVGRVATYDLARRVDRGENIAAVSAMVKTFTTETYVRVADHGLQILGGAGYLRSSAMQRHYRDARLLTIGGGTSEIMRNVISRSVLSD